MVILWFRWSLDVTAEGKRPVMAEPKLFVIANDRPRVLVNERFIIVRLKTKDPEHRIIDLKIQKHAIRYIADQIED